MCTVCKFCKHHKDSNCYRFMQNFTILNEKLSRAYVEAIEMPNCQFFKCHTYLINYTIFS